jgi:hypothetical protein
MIQVLWLIFKECERCDCSDGPFSRKASKTSRIRACAVLVRSEISLIIQVEVQEWMLEALLCFEVSATSPAALRWGVSALQYNIRYLSKAS